MDGNTLVKPEYFPLNINNAHIRNATPYGD